MAFDIFEDEFALAMQNDSVALPRLLSNTQHLLQCPGALKDNERANVDPQYMLPLSEHDSMRQTIEVFWMLHKLRAVLTPSLQTTEIEQILSGGELKAGDTLDIEFQEKANIVVAVKKQRKQLTLVMDLSGLVVVSGPAARSTVELSESVRHLEAFKNPDHPALMHITIRSRKLPHASCRKLKTAVDFVHPRGASMWNLTCLFENPGTCTAVKAHLDRCRARQRSSVCEKLIEALSSA